MSISLTCRLTPNSAPSTVTLKGDAWIESQNTNNHAPTPKNDSKILNVYGTTINIPGKISLAENSETFKILQDLEQKLNASTGPTQAEKQKLINKAEKDIKGIIQKGKPLPPPPHPHLGSDFTGPIRKALHPDPIATNIKPQNDAALASFQKQGIIDQDGKIDFTKLGVSSGDIRKADLSGEIWIDENGKFQMKITGNIGDTSADALKKLKAKVNNTFVPKGPNSPISINPESARKLSAEDQAALARGGQIQFLTTQDGNMLKLVLDPGKNGENAELTVGLMNAGKSRKIPLSAVLGGEDFNGARVTKNGHPILEDWSEQDLFSKATAQREVERWIPFTSRFDRITADNSGDVGRIQAQNTLWDAVYTYLDATSEPQNAPKAAKEPEAQAAVAEAEHQPQATQAAPGAQAATTSAAPAPEHIVQTSSTQPTNASKLPLNFPEELDNVFKTLGGLSDALSQLLSTLQAKEAQAPEAPKPLIKAHINPFKTTSNANTKELLNAAQNFANAIGGLKENLATAAEKPANHEDKTQKLLDATTRAMNDLSASLAAAPKIQGPKISVGTTYQIHNANSNGAPLVEAAQNVTKSLANLEESLAAATRNPIEGSQALNQLPEESYHVLNAAKDLMPVLENFTQGITGQTSSEGTQTTTS